jgi:DNA-binding NarL/FixJ family response regulator
MSEIRRAIVIDDDRFWQEILSELLREEGLAVDQATDLEDALKKIRRFPHRLAIVDLSLYERDHTDKSGLTILQHLNRSDPSCQKIMLSGNATVEDTVKALQDFGAFTLLQKNRFKRKEFKELVRAALRRPPQQATLQTEAGMLTTSAGQTTEVKPRFNALLVEDDAGWQELLAEALSESACEVTACFSHAEASSWLRRQRFDLAIVDLALSDQLGDENDREGWDLIRMTADQSVPTIVVSGHIDQKITERLLEGYSVRACLSKQQFSRANLLKFIAAALADSGFEVNLALTGREAEVAQTLAKGMSNAEMAAELGVSTNTIKRHLKSIFRKLDVRNRSAAAIKIRDLRLAE